MSEFDNILLRADVEVEQSSDQKSTVEGDSSPLPPRDDDVSDVRQRRPPQRCESSRTNPLPLKIEGFGTVSVKVDNETAEPTEVCQRHLESRKSEESVAAPMRTHSEPVRHARESVRIIAAELDEVAASMKRTEKTAEVPTEESEGESTSPVVSREHPKPKSAYRTLTRTRKFVDSQGQEVTTTSTKIVIEGQEHKSRDDFNLRWDRENAQTGYTKVVLIASVIKLCEWFVFRDSICLAEIFGISYIYISGFFWLSERVARRAPSMA